MTTISTQRQAQLLNPGDRIEFQVVKFGRWTSETYTVESVYVGHTHTTLRLQSSRPCVTRELKNTAHVTVLSSTTVPRFPL